MSRGFYNVPSAKLIQVLEVTTSEGAGTEESPIRSVTYYLEPETGRFLARYDAMADQERRKEARA